MTGSAIAILSNVVVLLFVIVVILSVAVLLHHVVTERQRRADRLRFESAASVLIPALIARDRRLDRDIAMVRLRCGDGAVALVLRKIRIDLKGEPADRAAILLEQIGETDRLISAAKSRREWKRLAAIRALGECGGMRALKTLASAAKHDPSDAVRNAAREGLLWARMEEAARVALDSFVARPPQRTGARQTFYMLLATASESHIAALIRSGELPPAELKLALEAVGDAGRRWAVALAKDHLMSHDPELRATSVRVIGKTGGDSEVRMVMHALDDAEWFVRAAAARSLEWMLSASRGGAAARERLRKHLDDPSWWVRANSARALAAAGSEGRLLLQDAESNGNERERDAARAMLAIAETFSVGADSGRMAFDPDMTLDERTFRPGGVGA